jgi:signal transduction histidine kinase
LSIVDDGRGFDARARATQAGFGLAGMRERAALIGGKLVARSTPNRGTQISVTAPLDRVSTT